MSLNIGMVGTGWFANKHANMLASMEEITISGICGSSLEKSERMASEYPGAKGYEKLRDMLDDQKLDAVYLCVPPFAHGDAEQELIERSIPFFVEKPLAVDLETPTAILEGIQKKNLLTSVGYHFRYMDGTAKAKELLQERTVGMALGYWMGNMPGVYWWRKAEGSGGQFVEQTTHIVDLLRDLLGEVDEVYAAYASRHMPAIEEGVSVPDVGTVTLKMKNGIVANISNTCMLPLGHTSGLHLYTDAGVLELGHQGLKDIALGTTAEHHNRNNPYEAENRAFLHALRTGDASFIRSTYADAWLTQQVTIAANRSAEAGQPVKL